MEGLSKRGLLRRLTLIAILLLAVVFIVSAASTGIKPKIDIVQVEEETFEDNSEEIEVQSDEIADIIVESEFIEKKAERIDSGEFNIDVVSNNDNLRGGDLPCNFNDPQCRDEGINCNCKLNEGDTLSYFINFTWVPSDLERSICVWAVPSSLPPGATFPTAQGFGSVTSTFEWTPDMCQARDYLVIYQGGQDCFAPQGQLNVDHFVNNVNRPPGLELSTSFINLLAGEIAQVGYEANDIDQIECGDDLVSVSAEVVPGGINNPIILAGNINWQTTLADVGDHVLTTIVTDTSGDSAEASTDIQVKGEIGECSSNSDCNDGNACSIDTCDGISCTNSYTVYGDVYPQGTGNGVTDLDDILYVLGAFSDVDPINNFPGADIFPCGGNSVVDLDDILGVLSGFSGNDPCGCGNPHEPLCCTGSHSEGECFIAEGIDDCTSQGGAIMECMGSLNLGGLPPITSLTNETVTPFNSTDPLYNSTDSVLADLARNVTSTGINNTAYVPGSYVCADFAGDLERNLTARGYNATFTAYWCHGGVGNPPATAHAVTDVHLPDGRLVWIEPQTGRMINMDMDGDGVVEYDNNAFTNSAAVTTDDNCQISVWEDRAAAVAAGVPGA